MKKSVLSFSLLVALVGGSLSGVLWNSGSLETGQFQAALIDPNSSGASFEDFSDSFVRELDQAGNEEDSVEVIEEAVNYLERFFGGVEPEALAPEDEAEEEPVPDAFYGAAPSELTEVLLHPNGQVLSWAMFYKFYADKLGADVSTYQENGEEWFVAYERWFRDQFPTFPPSDAADPAVPEVVMALYGGLPEGVETSRKEVTLRGAAPLTTLSQELNQLALDEFTGDGYVLRTVEDVDTTGQYVSAYLQDGALQQLLYSATDEPMTWADLWQHIQDFEAARDAASGGRDIPPEQTNPAYAAWFQRHFPELTIPSEGEYVTVAEAQFFLDGNLPEGSYGVDVDIQQMIADLETPRSVSLSGLAAGATTEELPEFQQQDDGSYVYDALPLPVEESAAYEQFQDVVRGLRDFIQALSEDTGLLEDFLSLQDDLLYQADLQGVVEGDGDEISAYSDVFEAGLTEADGETLNVLYFRPVFPDFLTGIENLSALFEGAETPDLANDVSVEALSSDSSDLIEITCSQTDNGEIIDTSPECNPNL